MSHAIEISDDDDSIEEVKLQTEKCDLSSDEDTIVDDVLTSDEELPSISVKTSRQALINNMFPSSTRHRKTFTRTTKDPPANMTESHEYPVYKKMIGGIEIQLPVDPYGSQIALMFKVITAINKSQNCLLESPTGSGKTLALLCASLAWQQHEEDKIAKENANQFFSDHPDLDQLHGAAEYITTPTKKTIDSPEKFFSKPNHGQKSIYDPVEEVASSSTVTRQKHLNDSPEGQNENLVTIHKRRKLNDSELSENVTPPEIHLTPEMIADEPQATTPQRVSVPTIYYGARTHKQLQQVIKEFGRTAYCKGTRMTILSSRDNSCIRPFDRSQWSSKNDMCRGCIKKIEQSKGGDGVSTNCKYYDNRKCLGHRELPDAFDLRDLVAAGEELNACPYYAAREMSHTANIVFCPYNYLIDPSIRSNLQIQLAGNVLVIDEAHNIEDICRDAASFVITRDQVLAAMKELEIVLSYRFSNQDVSSFVSNLLKVMQNWDQWFVNQLPLINRQAITNNEASHVWEVQHFLQTLHNHNLGQQHYSQFQRNADLFSKQLREDSRTLSGVTQATGTLLESISTVLGYLFRDCGQFADDFRPVLQRNLTTSAADGATSWRSSQFNKSIEKDSLSLRLICMNSAVVFAPLAEARCVVLASGTLTPLLSLHSELGAHFPLQISPNHVIPKERVWIGSLVAGARGTSLRCTSGATARADVQDALGDALLRVARITPHGVLCFLPSYRLMNLLAARWRDTGVWEQLEELKHVFMENKNVRDHDDIMEDYYKYVETEKGAILIAVYRGKVSEGMDFKDNQARAVVAVGIPYPNTFDLAVKEKMTYNDKYTKNRKLLNGKEWLRVQAYRALNQAVGRCVRHRGDWGAVLLVDERYQQPYYTEHLCAWAKSMLGKNHHTYESLVDGPNSLESFMLDMSLKEKEEI